LARPYAFLLLSCLASCKGCDAPDPQAKDAAVVAAPPSASSSVAAIDAAPPVASADAATAESFDGGDVDAGASACRLAYGPAEMPFRGTAAMITTPSELRLVANDNGKPRIFPIPIAPPTSAPEKPARPTSFSGMRWPPCEVAGKWAYCEAPGGAIVRSLLDGRESKEIAKCKPGTRIAASTLGANHSIVGYLDKRKTTEGDMLQAFAVVDDGEVQRLSEEGAGATSVRLVPHAGAALAVYLDTRSSMVPTHVRPLSEKDGKLTAGSDVVTFVGPPPERGVDFAIAKSKTSAFVLLPTAKDIAGFGMAAVPIEDPPKVDAPAVWSMYPNGLDPAPIGATVGEGKIYVARVRPREAMPGALRVIELGTLDDKGAFTSLGTIADGRHVTDISVATDGHGAVWILYGDSTITWLERRVCP
jgi:hypothetical protein